jgi:hypothetical protein
MLKNLFMPFAAMTNLVEGHQLNALLRWTVDDYLVCLLGTRLPTVPMMGGGGGGFCP